MLAAIADDQQILLLGCLEKARLRMVADDLRVHPYVRVPLLQIGHRG
jgi:hypothetical protein